VGSACGTRGRGEKSVQDFGGKAEGKRPLGGPRRRWEDGLRMDLRVGCVGIGFDWLRIGTGGDVL
jgi:hypothetical protein